MGWRVLTLLAVAGCGRIAFDAVAGSCRDLPPGSPSGTYQLDFGSAYCEMTTAGGGWTRIADVDAAAGCPGAWMRVANPAVCMAGNLPVGGGARSAEFTSPIAYAEVMGVVRGYQWSSPDGFGDTRPGIDGSYVDGLGITYRDNGARQHIWTFPVGWSNTNFAEWFRHCPCDGGPVGPSWIGNAYLCASGHNDAAVPPTGMWYVDDPLYDAISPGMGCDTGGQFVTSLGAPTESPIEARIMMDQDSVNEDMGIAAMQLFVR